MGDVVQLPKRNVQHASLEELEAAWDAWDGVEPLIGGFDPQSVHAELNRRGEGWYCAV